MRKAAVIYVSSNGNTEETVGRIKNENIDIINLKITQPSDIIQYEKIYIGFGIYAGALPRKIIRFLKDNTVELRNKEVAFFIHGLDSENNHQDIVKACYPQIEDIAKKSYYYLGGSVDLKKQNFFIKQLFKGIAKKKEIDPNNMSNLKGAKIQEFAEEVNRV